MPTLTTAVTKSPTPAAALLPFLVLCPFTAIMYKTLAPELSHASNSVWMGNALVTFDLLAFIFYDYEVLCFTYWPTFLYHDFIPFLNIHIFWNVSHSTAPPLFISLIFFQK